VSEQTPPPRDSVGGRRRFILQRRVGAGAFGEVFLAEQDSGAGFTKPVALKLLNADVAGSREAARRMRDEARILGRLSHRNIVSVLDLVNFGDRWGVVMDYVPGADLEEVLIGLDEADERFPSPAAFEVGSAVCRALHAAWHASDGRGGQLRVVHRDIKPSNVRLTEEGEVKVLDFGVARVDLDTRESTTKAQGWIGTERFMAPERILMEGDTPAGDVYAAAVSLVELLIKAPLGRTPVLPDRHNPFIEEALIDIRPWLNGPDEAVEEAIVLLRSCLAANPTDRPSAVEASRRMASVARKLRGEGLPQFATRFVPAIAARNEANSEKVDGVLSENMGHSGSLLENREVAPGVTYLAPQTLLPQEPAKWLPVLWVGLAAVAVMALLTVVVGAGAAWMVLRPAADEALASAELGIRSGAPVEVVIPEPTEDSGLAVPVEGPPPVVETPVSPNPAPIVIVSTPRPAAQPPVAVVSELTIADDAPRISRALVVMSDASAIDVTCGDRRASGTSSARIVDFPMGRCTVRANYLGTSLTGSVDISRAATITCTPTDQGLSCSAS
jgi:serine/threonine protein kinase